MVVKKLLEIIPRNGTPVLIGSDNGPAFAAQVTQGTVKVLGEDWKLQCANRPQSSGQVEHMSWTLKETLAKLIVETCGDWVAFLPCIGCGTPLTRLGLHHLGLCLVSPLPSSPTCSLTCSLSSVTLTCYISLTAAASVFKDIWPRLQQVYEMVLPPIPHHFQPEGWVYVRRHQHRTLEPHWNLCHDSDHPQ